MGKWSFVISDGSGRCQYRLFFYYCSYYASICQMWVSSSTVSQFNFHKKVGRVKKWLSKFYLVSKICHANSLSFFSSYTKRSSVNLRSTNLLDNNKYLRNSCCIIVAAALLFGTIASGTQSALGAPYVNIASECKYMKDAIRRYVS